MSQQAIRSGKIVWADILLGIEAKLDEAKEQVDTANAVVNRLKRSKRFFEEGAASGRTWEQFCGLEPTPKAGTE